MNVGNAGEAKSDAEQVRLRERTIMGKYRRPKEGLARFSGVDRLSRPELFGLAHLHRISNVIPALDYSIASTRCSEDVGRIISPSIIEADTFP